MKKIIVLFLSVVLNLYSSEYNWFYPESGTTKRLIKINVIDKNTIYCVGVSGTIIKSNDGGITWKRLSIPSTSHFHKIHFLDNNNGWVAGQRDIINPDSYLFFTSDGGENWNPIDIDVEYSITGIYFENINKGFIIDYYGNLFKTIDGGKSWTKVYKFDNLINEMFFSNNKLYIVGKSGFISFANIDNLNDWTDISIDTQSEITDLTIFNNNIWVIGMKGFLYKYNMDNKTWEDLNLGESYDCWGISHNDTELMIAGGQTNGNGFIAFSDNLGVDWLLYNFSGSNFAFIDVKPIDNNKVISVGKYGGIAYGIRKETSVTITNIQNPISIYPNPAKDEMIITIDEAVTNNADIKIYNSKGLMIKELNTKIENNLIKINVSDLPSGMYYLKIINGVNLMYEKFIVNR